MSRSGDMRDQAERFARDVDSLQADQAVEESTDGAYRADLELANLLSRGQFVPDTRFKLRLRSHLLQVYEDQEVRKMSPMKVFRSLVRPALVAGLSAVVVLGTVFAVSPEVRAAAQTTAQELVARFVEVGSPWALLPRGENQPASPGAVAAPGKEALPVPDEQTADVVPSGPGQPPGTGNQGVEIDQGKLAVPGSQAGRELISLEEAQAKLDFKIRMPAVLPEGYTFLGVASTPEPPSGLSDEGKAPADLPRMKPPQMAILVFGDSAGEVLMLSEILINDPAPAEVPLPAGEGSVKEVTVNGQPAQYIEGIWSPSGWVSEGNHELHWQSADGIMFHMISRTLGLDELLAVAESIE